jgi:enamine deaminase RidA (YjgF/YER057c/UK114 family)
MSHEIISPKSVHSTEGVGYSHVSRVGNLLFLAGQIALDREGKLVGKGDVEAQTRQVYANLRAIVDEVGGPGASVVKFTTYLTHRDSLAGFRKIRNDVSPRPFPPNTLVFIDGLASPDYLIEIEAIVVTAK